MSPYGDKKVLIEDLRYILRLEIKNSNIKDVDYNVYGTISSLYENTSLSLQLHTTETS